MPKASGEYAGLRTELNWVGGRGIPNTFKKLVFLILLFKQMVGNIYRK
jgi:hypothetical protein